jgi:hypothetical protein
MPLRIAKSERHRPLTRPQRARLQQQPVAGGTSLIAGANYQTHAWTAQKARPQPPSAPGIINMA